MLLAFLIPRVVSDAKSVLLDHLLSWFFLVNWLLCHLHVSWSYQPTFHYAPPRSPFFSTIPSGMTSPILLQIIRLLRRSYGALLPYGLPFPTDRAPASLNQHCVQESTSSRVTPFSTMGTWAGQPLVFLACPSRCESLSLHASWGSGPTKIPVVPSASAGWGKIDGSSLSHLSGTELLQHRAGDDGKHCCLPSWNETVGQAMSWGRGSPLLTALGHRRASVAWRWGRGG